MGPLRTYGHREDAPHAQDTGARTHTSAYRFSPQCCQCVRQTRTRVLQQHQHSVAARVAAEDAAAERAQLCNAASRARQTLNYHLTVMKVADPESG